MYIFNWKTYFLKPYYIIRDIYYCYIPELCRHCDLLTTCRTDWKSGRKCKSGCIIIKQEKIEAERNDKLDALLDYVEELESKGLLK